MHRHTLDDGITVLASAAELPGLGHLPVNCFVLHAQQPVLVDTGMPADREEFLEHLWSTLEPADLRWVWVTHPDRDHTGALMHVLEAAPQAKLVTTFGGYGILSLEHEIPLDRIRLVNRGETLDVGDRLLHAFRPPLYDSPVTTGFRDGRTGAAFSSDCFGAPVSELAQALAEDVRVVPSAHLVEAQHMWAVADSPWVTGVDRARYAAELREFARPGLPLVLSTHLPPARDLGERLIDTLAGAPDVPEVPDLDQAALDALLASFAPDQRSADDAAAAQPAH